AGVGQREDLLRVDQGGDDRARDGRKICRARAQSDRRRHAQHTVRGWRADLREDADPSRMHWREVTGARMGCSPSRERRELWRRGASALPALTRRATRVAALSLLFCCPLRADDWPMLGGRPDRNMVSAEKNLPVDWSPKKNLKW